MSNDVHPKLIEFIPVARSIATAFENMCEVVIHDLKHPEKSLIFIAGKLTGRKLGAPITNLVLEELRKNGDNSPDIIGYKTSTKDGKILKSSTMFIRDKDKKIIGCICINLNITQLLICQQILENFIKINDNHGNLSNEEFHGDVNEALNAIIEHVLADYPTPQQIMAKEDKLNIVKQLDEKGVFLVKGAVDQVAAVLGVSRYTIYNYLEEARSKPIFASVL